MAKQPANDPQHNLSWTKGDQRKRGTNDELDERGKKRAQTEIKRCLSPLASKPSWRTRLNREERGKGWEPKDADVRVKTL